MNIENVKKINKDAQMMNVRISQADKEFVKEHNLSPARIMAAAIDELRKDLQKGERQ